MNDETDGSCLWILATHKQNYSSLLFACLMTLLKVSLERGELRQEKLRWN